MKYLICLTAFLLAGLVAPAQETVLKGTLGFAGGESFTYELHLTEEANGTLRGYSLLYTAPGKETRATLVGLVNREEKTLSFSEQSIDYSNNFESRAYICRLSASLNYRPHASAGRPGLFGVTGSNEYNDKRCSTGTLSFNASDALRKFFTLPPQDATATASIADLPLPENKAGNLPLPQPLPAPAAAPVTAQENPTASTLQPAASSSQPAPSIENMPANQKPSQRRYYFPEKEKQAEPAVVIPPKPKDTTGGLHLTDGEAADITCSSDVLEVSVFDGSGTIDGDQINLMYNDRPLLNRFTLRAAPQQVRLPVANGGRLRIITVSEGSEKPCVAHIHIKDGSQLHRFVINNTVGKEAAIILHKDPKEGQP